MKRLVMAMALVGVFSISGVAGDIHNVDSPAPAPSATPQGMKATSSSPTDLTQAGDSTEDSTESVFDAALSAVLSVIGLVI